MATTRFRTQDTRAKTAQKLNDILFPLGYLFFREVPQTYDQWSLRLNDAVRTLRADGYDGVPKLIFRMGEPRAVWARKLNTLVAGIAAGNA